MTVDRDTGTTTIIARNLPLNEVLAVLARAQGLNMIAAEDITAKVSVTLEEVPFEKALTQILSVAGYTWVQQDDVLIITAVSADRKLSPDVQGRQVRVFTLDYVSAEDVDVVVKGLLSAAGQSFPTLNAEDNNRKTRDTLVVEDIPEYLDRIEQYIRQVDRPPRQVLIEVHILEIELEDNAKHGVNLEYFDIGNPNITLKTQDFATLPAVGTPAFLFSLSASSLTTLVEALQTTSDAKTLANPKVLTLNGQKARIQIGEQLGYRITTTTQTSTMESVDFLDTGVVLDVTPRITQDNQVIMYVKPQVSTGEINATTLLPEEETTEVETALMLPDGYGMVIGGLIQEAESETQSKVPIVGDMWLVGRLFQKRELRRKRTEIIIALIPHVVPYQPGTAVTPGIDGRECRQYQRATRPLMYGDLRENPRPSEARLTDAGQRIPLRYKAQKLRPLQEGTCWTPPSPGCAAPCPKTGKPSGQYFHGGQLSEQGEAKVAGRAIRTAKKAK